LQEKLITPAPKTRPIRKVMWNFLYFKNCLITIAEATQL